MGERLQEKQSHTLAANKTVAPLIPKTTHTHKLIITTRERKHRAEPTDADLQTFLQTHPDLLQSEPLYSFRQVYLNPQQHAANLAADEARLLAELQRVGSNADLSSLGDPFLLAPSFQNASLAEVKQVFGDQFASALANLPAGHWQGPVTSGYGAHFVFLSHRTERSLPALAEIRDQVRREWFDAKRNEATEKFYQSLLKRYTVKIEPPEEKKVALAH